MPSFRRIPHEVSVFILGRGVNPAWFKTAVDSGKIQIFERNGTVLYRVADTGKGGGFYVGHDGDYLVNDPISGMRPLTKDEFEKEYEEY